MPESSDSGIVLDTHVWLWLNEGAPERIAPSARREIEALAGRGRVFVSVISVWEVAMLESRNRIQLSLPVDRWVHRALRAPGVQLLELSPEIAIESTRLPGEPHGGPADRILMASARVIGGRLATRDTGILGYASAGHLAVLDARP
jgi:PIN domain nuclease of toxin-antitoxin system